MKQNNNEKPLSFSIFRGKRDAAGKVQAVRRVGKCLFYQGTGSHVIHIDLLPGQTNTFYLRPSKQGANKEYDICLKETLVNGNLPFVYRRVGIAKLCSAPNEGLLYLEWDFVGPANIYMGTLTGDQDQNFEKVGA